MKSQFIQDFVDNNQVDSTFAIVTKSSTNSYNAKPGLWFSLLVADKTGEIPVKYWGGSDEDVITELHNSFIIGDVVSITGAVKYDTYDKCLVISIDARSGQTVTKQDSFDKTDFLPVTKKNIDDMVSILKTTLDELQNADIKRLLKSFFDDASFMEKYSTSPAASKYHHSYVGGLIEHVLNMVELSKIVAKQYDGNLDVDLMIAGCILHDIGKLEELEAETSIQYTTIGSLFGHISIGAQMVQSKIDSLEEFPVILKNKILHLVLSHHGTLEFGSPVEPKFPEAICIK